MHGHCISHFQHAKFHAVQNSSLTNNSRGYLPEYQYRLDVTLFLTTGHAYTTYLTG